MTDNIEEIWLATIEVEPKKEGSLPEGAIGAFATVVALASSPREFRSIIKEYVSSNGWTLVDVSDAEPLKLREEFAELEDECQAVIAEVQADGITNATTFECYDNDD